MGFILSGMKLERYIELLKLNRSEAARQMMISRVQLTNVLNGRKNPGITFMRKAIEWSKGAVTLHDFMD